jgi:hypothetical protein
VVGGPIVYWLLVGLLQALNLDGGRAEAWGVVVGVMCGLALVIAYPVWEGRARFIAAKQALSKSIEGLQADFPAECRAWGQRALQEPEALREVLRDLERRR